MSICTLLQNRMQMILSTCRDFCCYTSLMIVYSLAFIVVSREFLLHSIYDRGETVTRASDSEGAKNVTHLVLHCLNGEFQLTRDLFVLLAGQKMFQDLSLSWSELRHWRVSLTTSSLPLAKRGSSPHSGHRNIFPGASVSPALAAHHVITLAEFVAGIELLTAETFPRHVHHEPVIHVATDSIAPWTITRHLHRYSHVRPPVFFR